MVDFEGGKHSDFGLDNAIDDSVDPSSNRLQNTGASYSPGTLIVSADANGAVTLPAGVSLEDITVQGRDLVINLADGSTIVIPDGAIIVPQIIIDGLAVPPLDLAALLNGIDPQAGPQAPGSSGGNFAGDEGAIQDAFDLGNLLPYTELGLPIVQEEEVIPDIVDRDPDVVIETPDNPIGVENAIATVNETGLPARGGEGASEPPGIGENADGNGSNDSNTSETTSGTIVFDAPDGLSAIIMNGTEITSVGQTFTTIYGTLTITSIDLPNGMIGFSYTLADNLLGETADGNFAVTVIDLDGDEASATLNVIVIDDSPLAADDIGIVPAATFGPIFGNVLDNDQSGADDYPEGEEGPDAVTGFSNAGGSANPGDSLQGDYGVLTLNADGSYTYTRDFNTPGGVEDSFEYTIVDQDDSTSTATLVIQIEDADDSIQAPDVGDGTVVNESGLPERVDPDEPEGTQEGTDGETTSGTITFTSPDGLKSITIAGVTVNLDNDPSDSSDDQVIVDNATGTFIVTGVTYDPATGDGTIEYTYTLGDNTSGDNTQIPFEIMILDLDDDPASDTLIITVIDDEPIANPDTDTVTEDGPLSAEGNVITDAEANGDNGADVEGADGALVAGVAAGNVAGPLETGVNDAINGKYGTLTVDSDGNYTYTLYTEEQNADAYALVQGLDSTDSFTDEVFSYTLEDGDGDTKTTTLTITVNGADDPVVITGLDVVGGEASVDEDDLADGSDTSKESLTQPNPDGSFTFASVDGAVSVEIGSETYTVAFLLTNDFTANPLEIGGNYGTLTIRSFTPDLGPDGSVVGGTFTYDYTLGDNTLDHDDAGEDNVFDSFAVRIEDTDGSFDTASLDVEVVDDIPDVETNTSEVPTLFTDDTVVGNSGSDSDSGDFSGLFTPHFYADGPNAVDSIVYGFSINGGDGTDSGLDDTLTGDNILLRLNGDVIEGYLENSTDTIAFTLTLDPDTGSIEQSQLRAIEHDDPADPVESGDNAQFMSADLISLTATVTDGDGDQDSASVNIGDSFGFTDDGPAIGSRLSFVLKDEDNISGGNNDSAAGDDGNASGTIFPFEIDYNADGPNADEITVSLTSVTTSDPNVGAISLTSGGDAVLFDWDASTNTLTGYTTDIGDPVMTLVFDVDAGTVAINYLKPLDHPSHDADGVNDGPEIGYEDNISLTFGITVIDGDGDTVSTSLVVQVDDDMAVAVANSLELGEGESDGGNVVADDSAGADGYATDGPVVDANFVSANQGITLTSKDVAPDGTITIVTTAGTLTLLADGTYTFDSPTNTINGDAEIIFSYTIEDGDGDQATATLTIDINNVGGDVEDDDVYVDEDGLPNGTGELTDNIPDNYDSEIDANGSIRVVDNLGDPLPGDYTYTLDAGGTPGPGPNEVTLAGTYGTLVLNTETGTYTYTLTSNYDHEDGLGENDSSAPPPADSFAYTVTDNLGNTMGTGSIDVTIKDDIPNVDVEPDGDLPDAMTTFDSETPGGTEETVSGTSVATADFSDTFTINSFQYGADGAGTLDTTYELILDPAFTEGDASGLFSDGAIVYLYQLADGTIIGSTSSTKPAGVDGSTVFTLTVGTDSGIVTQTQYAELDHSVDEDAPAYDDDTIPLPANLVEIKATATIIDSDEDTVTDSATIDLSSFVNFADDGPDAAISAAGVTLTHDETPGDDGDDDVAGPLAVFDDVVNPGEDLDVAGTGPIGFAVSTAGLSSTGSTYGADGEGTTVFSLELSDPDGVDSGLNTTEGANIILFLEDGLVVGRVGDENGVAAFAIAIDETNGEISVVQYLSIEHGDDSDHDDPESINADVLFGVVTVTDEEGDSDDASVSIGELITFEDDGPAISQNGEPVGELVLDESLEDPDGDGIVSDQADFSGNFDADFGADGAGSPDLAYAFLLNGLASGDLGADAVSIGSGLYALDASDIQDVGDDTDGIGQGDEIMLEFDGDDIVGVANGTEYFRISVDSDGMVTFSQTNNIWHGNTGDDDDTETLTTATPDLIQLEATAKDGDDDTASATINLGADVFKIEDDGPSTDTNGAVQLDDDAVSGANGNPGDNGDGSDDADAVNVTGFLSFDFGTDDAGSIDFAAMDGESVLLNGVTVTFTWAGDTLTANDGSKDVFTVQITNPTTGAYTVTQLAALDHHVTGDDTETDASFDLTYTVTDADGDTETGTLTVNIDDDTPTALDDTFTQEQAEENMAVNGDVSTNDSPGADGLGAYTFNNDADNNGVDVSGNLSFNADGSFTYTPDAGEEGTVTFSYTLTDGDGDSVTKQVTINLADDSEPSAGSVIARLDDDGYGSDGNNPESAADDLDADTDGNNDDTVFTGTLSGSAGPDGPATFSFVNMDTLTGSAGLETVTYSWDGVDTLTATISDGPRDGTPLFTIQITDAAAGDYTVTLLTNFLHDGGNDGEQAGGVDLVLVNYTVSDSDNPADTDTGLLTIEFGDDSPLFATDLTPAPDLVTDDDNIPDTDSASFATLFTPLYGADGQASVNPITYALAVGGIGNGQDSGLDDTLTGNNILLRIKDGDPNTIEGYLSGSTTTVAFTINVNPATGLVTLTQNRAIKHDNTGDPDETFLSGEAETMAAGLVTLTATITDGDGDKATNTVDIGDSFHFEDDGPTIGGIQDGTANNDPTTVTLSTGSLNFTAGADGIGSVVTISYDTTGIKSDGYNLVQVQNGSTLSVYQDVDGSGAFSAGDLLAFQLNVDPSTDQYTFDLVRALDGVVENAPIGGSSSFGAGPTQSQVLTTGAGGTGEQLAVVSGWQITGSFNLADWQTTGNIDPSELTLAAVNGSTSGWGVDSNTFDLNEFMRFDFGAPMDDFDGAGPYVPPAVSLPEVHYADFDLINYKAGDVVEFVVHYVGGGSVDHLVADTNAEFDNIYRIEAPEGKTIDWIDVYVSTIDGGSGKISLVAVGRESETVDIDLDFTVTISDGDGDTDTDSFTINVADGNSPSVATPVVLDLNGDAADFTSIASNNVAYDYDGDGVKSKTAWIAAGAAILAYDANNDNAVTDASEFVFGHDGMTDLEALATEYDSNGDGKLDASDSTYGKFGVWLDDGDGVSEAGEFVSLSDAGITSIELVSDGNAFGAADGDVTVFGTASFTMQDGTTGNVYDAGFAIGGDVVDGTMEALMAMAAADGGSNGSEDTGTQTTQDESDVTLVLDDAMAGSTVDALIDHYADDPGDAPALADAGGYLVNATLTLSIDGGAFAFESSNVADSYEEAASLAVANA